MLLILNLSSSGSLLCQPVSLSIPPMGDRLSWKWLTGEPQPIRTRYLWSQWKIFTKNINRWIFLRSPGNNIRELDFPSHENMFCVRLWWNQRTINICIAWSLSTWICDLWSGISWSSESPETRGPGESSSIQKFRSPESSTKVKFQSRS